jgi:lauroyl/myristoyl acyltransferase
VDADPFPVGRAFRGYAVTLRRLGSWKTLFYSLALPALRGMAPQRADAILGAAGRLLCRRRRREVERTVRQAREALGAPWAVAGVCDELAASTPRFLARDLLLDHLDDESALGRFQVEGFDHLRSALAHGRGVVLLGSHLGAHLAGLHWLDRQRIPMRLLVQRPTHVSGRLQARFDADHPRFPQSAFTLRRAMLPAEAARCVMLARDALRAGFAVYLNGDVLHNAASARAGRLLGREHRFAALWAELARTAEAPVLTVFCIPRPAGRFHLAFDAPWFVGSMDPTEAVAEYLRRLETWIVREPSAAVAHLSWPALRPRRSLARPHKT